MNENFESYIREAFPIVLGNYENYTRALISEHDALRLQYDSDKKKRTKRRKASIKKAVSKNSSFTIDAICPQADISKITSRKEQKKEVKRQKGDIHFRKGHAAKYKERKMLDAANNKIKDYFFEKRQAEECMFA